MPKQTRHKPRSLSHPGVVAIAKSLNRICGTPYVGKEVGVLDNAMGIILGTDCAGYFDRDGWTPTSIREATLAYAQHAPVSVFKRLQADVEKARSFVEFWDERGWIDAEYANGAERDLALAKRGFHTRKEAT